MQPYHRDDSAPDIIGDDRIGPVTAFAQRISGRISRLVFQRLSRGLRRHPRAVLIGVGLVAVATAAAIAVPALTASGPVIQPARAGGVFASGTADGHPWRLAVQDIADPGYRCLPAITLNGTDADPVYPAPGTGAVVALGPAMPGFGFGFVEVPATSGGITVNGHNVPAVLATECGYRYQVTGFAYPLNGSLRITLDNQPAGALRTISLPQMTPQPSAAAAQVEGMWVNSTTVPGPAVWKTVAQGELAGQPWFIQVQFGPGGDCYEFSAPGRDEMGACGPVSTPGGPETLMALPLNASGVGTTAYAVQVSPDTARLRAVFSDGSAAVITPQVVVGRKYAAFLVPPSRTLDRLVWLDAKARVIGSTAAPPPFGYIQLQP